MISSLQLSDLVLNALETSDEAEQTALTQVTSGRQVNADSDNPALPHRKSTFPRR